MAFWCCRFSPIPNFPCWLLLVGLLLALVAFAGVALALSLAPTRTFQRVRGGGVFGPEKFEASILCFAVMHLEFPQSVLP